VAGDLVYFFVAAPDADRAQAFYGGLLGWEFSPGNVPGGHNVANVSPPGGLFGTGGGGRTEIRVCFEVADIDAALARVRELGGRAGDPQEIPSGRWAECSDDQGVEFCLWSGPGPG
jgi:predicted enzyme related to lactoylglutathione lyase